MKLIVGLGNPGEKYVHTRHNVGFQFLDYLYSHSEPFDIAQGKLREESSLKGVITRSFARAQAFGSEAAQARRDDNLGFEFDKYSNSEICELELNGKEILLVKPQTFMNNSGIAVQKLVSRYTLHVTQDLFVVHDDLDIPFGRFKIQKGKGPELHYGVTSIEDHLKTKDFTRVRIGIDNREAENRIPGEAYTLQNFESDEERLLQNVFESALPSLSNLF